MQTRASWGATASEETGWMWVPPHFFSFLSLSAREATTSKRALRYLRFFPATAPTETRSGSTAEDSHGLSWVRTPSPGDFSGEIAPENSTRSSSTPSVLCISLSPFGVPPLSSNVNWILNSTVRRGSFCARRSSEFIWLGSLVEGVGFTEDWDLNWNSRGEARRASPPTSPVWCFVTAVSRLLLGEGKLPLLADTALYSWWVNDGSHHSFPLPVDFPSKAFFIL